MKRNEVMELARRKGSGPALDLVGGHLALLAGTFPELPTPTLVTEMKAHREEMSYRISALAIFTAFACIEASQYDGELSCDMAHEVYGQVGDSIGGILGMVREEVEGPSAKDELVGALMDVLRRRAARDAARRARGASDGAPATPPAPPAAEASGDGGTGADVAPDVGPGPDQSPATGQMPPPGEDAVPDSTTRLNS